MSDALNYMVLKTSQPNMTFATTDVCIHGLCMALYANTQGLVKGGSRDNIIIKGWPAYGMWQNYCNCYQGVYIAGNDSLCGYL